MDLTQNEATLTQFVFSFLFINIIILINYLCAKKHTKSKIAWFLPLVFCLYAFWDTDYFSFRQIFYNITDEFRDPLYYYISLISFDSYFVYRLIIWGLALLLFYKTCKRFDLNDNITAYIFAVYFLLTFSFARASLGMAMYFYGLSYLIKPANSNKTFNVIYGVLFVLSSYFGHRSMLPLIVMVPLTFIKLTKGRLFILVLFFPVIVIGIKLILNYFISGPSLDGQLEEFSNAARSYSSMSDFELNWKFKLITILRNSSHYILCIYLLYVFCLKKTSSSVPLHIKRLVTISALISCIALALTVTDIGIASVTSKRYLYMTGIPTCIALSYAVKSKICSFKRLNLLLIVSLIWAEGFFVGKIFSYYI